MPGSKWWWLCTTHHRKTYSSCQLSVDDQDALSERVFVLHGDPPSPRGHGMGAWGLQQSGAVACILSPIYKYIYIFIYLYIYIFLHFYISTFLHFYISTFLHFYISTFLHLYIYIFIYLYIYIFIYLYIYIFIYLYISTFLHFYISTFLHFYISTFLHFYIYIFIYLYIYIFIYLYIYIFIYLYIYIFIYLYIYIFIYIIHNHPSIHPCLHIFNTQMYTHMRTCSSFHAIAADLGPGVCVRGNRSNYTALTWEEDEKQKSGTAPPPTHEHMSISY